MTPDALIDLVLALDPLADLPRTGWLMRGVANPESIAAHSHGVALITMALTDALRDEGIDVDGEKALRLALLHDGAEAATGDIPGPAKSPDVKKALSVREHELMNDRLPAPYVALWEEVGGDSLEARIVHSADKIHMRIKALVYEGQGRARLDEFWKKPLPTEFNFVAALDANLRARRNA